MIEVISICSIVSEETKQKYDKLKENSCVNNTKDEIASLHHAIIKSGIEAMSDKESFKISEQMKDAFGSKDEYRIVEVAGLVTNANFTGMISLYVPKKEKISNSHDIHLICDGFGYTQANKENIVSMLSNIKEDIEKFISNIQSNQID